MLQKTNLAKHYSWTAITVTQIIACDKAADHPDLRPFVVSLTTSFVKNFAVTTDGFLTLNYLYHCCLWLMLSLGILLH